MRITVTRLSYSPESTSGVMCLGDRYFGVTLEDRLHDGPKEFGKTCIPAGRYPVILSMSKRFGKMLPAILSVPGFEGVRIHGGNTEKDTQGCILVAKDKVGKDCISGSLSARLVELLEADGGKHEIQIVNYWSNI